jgi:hypothetical protein
LEGRDAIMVWKDEKGKATIRRKDMTFHKVGRLYKLQRNSECACVCVCVCVCVRVAHSPQGT